MSQPLHPPDLGRRLAGRAAAVMVLLLGLCGVPASAMMIGNPQGTLWLGRAMDLRIPVRMDPGLPLVAECVRARVVDGDSALPERALHVGVRDANAAVSFIELRSSRALRAPFVQLEVSLQCQFGVTRQFTLLVEPPTAVEPELPQVAEASASQPERAPTARHSRHASAPLRHARMPHARFRHAERPQPRHAPARASAPQAHRHVGAVRAHEPGQGSRLRMQWLAAELAAPGAASPGLSTQAASRRPAPGEPSSSGPGVGPAVVGSGAAGYGAGAAPSAQIQHDEKRLAERVDELQARLAAEHERNQAHERELAELRSQMQHAAPRAPWWWNAALGALAVLCALLGLSLWQRRGSRSVSPWHDAAVLGQPAPSRTASAAASLPAIDAPSTFPPQSLRTGPSGFHVSAFQRPLSVPEQVQIDEVVDHGHLADFFIGLGDYDKAIDIMRRALAESGGALSVMPYLYLFDLYRRSARRADYEQLLEDCGSRLNVRIPAWDEHPVQAPRDLLDYPRALALLSAAWGTPGCLTVIERMIADDPRKPRAGFDLPAYRDLLDLYALARELQRNAPAQDDPPTEIAPDAHRRGHRDADRESGGELDLVLDLRGAPARGPAPRAQAARPRATPDDEPSTLPPLDFEPGGPASPQG